MEHLAGTLMISFIGLITGILYWIYKTGSKQHKQLVAEPNIVLNHVGHTLIHQYIPHNELIPATTSRIPSTNTRSIHNNQQLSFYTKPDTLQSSNILITHIPHDYTSEDHTVQSTPLSSYPSIGLSTITTQLQRTATSTTNHTGNMQTDRSNSPNDKHSTIALLSKPLLDTTMTSTQSANKRTRTDHTPFTANIVQNKKRALLLAGDNQTKYNRRTNRYPTQYISSNDKRKRNDNNELIPSSSHNRKRHARINQSNDRGNKNSNTTQDTDDSSIKSGTAVVRHSRQLSDVQMNVANDNTIDSNDNHNSTDDSTSTAIVPVTGNNKRKSTAYNELLAVLSPAPIKKLDRSDIPQIEPGYTYTPPPPIQQSNTQTNNITTTVPVTSYDNTNSTTTTSPITTSIVSALGLPINSTSSNTNTSTTNAPFVFGSSNTAAATQSSTTASSTPFVFGANLSSSTTTTTQPSFTPSQLPNNNNPFNSTAQSLTNSQSVPNFQFTSGGADQSVQPTSTGAFKAPVKSRRGRR